MSALRDAAMKSRAWPFEEARRILARYDGRDPAKGHVLFETGYGPSGLPHIGTFGEVARTTMIRRAFEVLSDIPTRLICFSDDVDGMRKVPDNVPNPAMLRQHLQRPLTSVPDPFGEHESFGHHNNAMLRRFLDTFGFEYEFISATEFYRSGRFDDTLRLAAERYERIMEIMLPSLREERQQTYSCFLPIHPETGRVLYVPVRHVDKVNHTITFDDETGREWTLPVTGGQVKLQWKPDFGARWAALDVDFEMYGKDHSTNTPIYDGICEALGGRAPNHFTYELFLDENGQKIMYQKPKTAKRLWWDVIPKAVDEYHQQLRAFPDQPVGQQVDNPVWHIHAGRPPESRMVVSFAMLLNLASVTGARDRAGLWGFIRRYAPGASPEANPDLDAAADFAVRYFRDKIAPSRVFREPDPRERAAIADLAARLRGWEGAADAEALQSVCFAVGRDHGFEPLRDWFRALYEVLLGASEGPRFGGFIALYGIDETVALIDAALARDAG
jgi:lysyl-tRNA synthetase class 1